MDLIDIGIYVSYGLIAVAILAAVILPLINSFSDPKKLVKIGVGLGSLLVVFFIGYALSSDEVTNTYMRHDVNASSSKLIGGALVTMYIFFVIAFASIIVTEVGKLFK